MSRKFLTSRPGIQQKIDAITRVAWRFTSCFAGQKHEQQRDPAL